MNTCMGRSVHAGSCLIEGEPPVLLLVVDEPLELVLVLRQMDTDGLGGYAGGRGVICACMQGGSQCSIYSTTQLRLCLSG